MEYFVTGNFKHNGREFRRGDTIADLDPATAAALLKLGCIQQPGSEEGGEPEAAAEAKTDPEVGGKEMETGEPSIDGEKERGEDKAEDITPEVAEAETTPGRGFLGFRRALSPDVGPKDDQAENAQPAASQESKDEPKEAEVDPSADL